MIYDDLLETVRQQRIIIDAMRLDMAYMRNDVSSLEQRVQLLERAMTDEEITVEDAARRVV